jgi:sodium/hydrogen antiporter
MGAADASVVLATVFLWCVFSARVARVDLTGPIVFVVAGSLYAALGLVELEVGHEAVKLVAEVTLVWVLFADATGVSVGRFRADLAMYARLLGVGLPLTVGLGTLAAIWLRSGCSGWTRGPPCSWAQRWPPRTPRLARRCCRIRRCRRGSAGC